MPGRPPGVRSPADGRQKCESTFELASAKFAQCRLTAESKFTKANDAAKLSAALAKCSSKLSDALGKAVTKYGGANCTAEAPSGFDAYLTQCSNDVEAASAIGGSLPDYVGDLTTCEADLAACQQCPGPRIRSRPGRRRARRLATGRRPAVRAMAPSLGSWASAKVT